MKTVVVAIVAVMLLSLPVSASDWSPVAKVLAKSTVYIESAAGSCTGFVVNADAKENKDYILTAAHCDGKELFADGSDTKIVYKDIKKDLMILEIDDTGRPALRLADNNPNQGDEVASLGYGWGLDRPMFRTAHVSDTETHIPEEGIGGPFIVIDAQFVGGQSGGAVANTAGEVVMIVQRGGGGVGLGVGAEMIRSKVGRYFGKAKQ